MDDRQLMSLLRMPPVDEDAAGKALALFNDIETKFSVFDIAWGGVQVWPMMRLGLFQKVLTGIGIFTYRPVLPSPPVRSRPERFRRNPLFRLRRSKIVVFRWGRTMRLAGDPFDIYTDPLGDVLEDVGAEIIDLSPHPLDAGRPLDSRTTRAEPLALTWGRIAGRVWPSVDEPDDETSRRFVAIGNALSMAFPTSVDLISEARIALQEFLRQMRIWWPVFAWRRPRVVVMGTQSYGFEGLIAAARACGALVAEIQHGAIYSAHLAYHFPDIRRIDHKPDVFLTFGRWWHDQFHYPANMKLHSIGFRALDDARAALRKRGRHQESIVILTGDQFYGGALIEVIKNLRLRFPDIPMIMRPHPTDTFDYLDAIELNGLANVKLADPRSESIHEFLSRGTRALCAASTAAIESTYLGLPTVAVLQGMTSVMGPVLEAGNVVICNTPEFLGDALENAPVPPAHSPLFEESGNRFHAFLNDYA